MDKVLALTGFAVRVLDFQRLSCTSIMVSGVLRSGGCHSLLLGKVTSKVSKVLQRNKMNDRKGKAERNRQRDSARESQGRNCPLV